jgi:DNA end-binding protein Ku
MALFALRTASEVRAPQFGSAEGDLDAEMVAIATAIIRQLTGKFDPSTFRDRYQDALRQLIEAKMKGLSIKPRAITTPPPVIDLMAALKRSLAREIPPQSAWRQKRNPRKLRPIGDRARCCYPCQAAKNGKPSPQLNHLSAGHRGARRRDRALSAGHNH